MVSSLAGIVETITGFFQQLVDSGYLTLDYIFYISLALELILIIFFLIKSSYSYELRLDRALDGLNRWLYYNQYIDESNLMEFNQKIKKSPKLLRYHWQQYMLYRDKEPSFYMSEHNAIEKPLHTSSFTSNIKNLSAICYAIAGGTFVLNLASFATIGQTNLGYVLLNSLLTPIAIVLFATFFTILLRSWQNANLSGLYQNFHLFTRYIDKGCTTLPEYIDFEVLFTKEEIKKGIPVLNEYLEKRARQEQKELEQAMLNSVDHEEYDFTQLGLNGSQILDRAMKETEIYLNQRQRALADIQQLESEIESAKRNYENNQKEYERKMQASKENVDRLRKQQEESTNRIESNYIRKQQTDEIKKQEQLEKDYESTTLRYNQETLSLTNEINARKQEIEIKKKGVEDAMKAEYGTFSSRVHKAINEDVVEKDKEAKTKLIDEKETYAKMLEEANSAISERDVEITKLVNLLKENNIEFNQDEFFDENLKQEAAARKGSSLDLNSFVKETEEPEYDEYGGYYDAQGYYRYQNGTYYDPEGNFHDEFGGHYDKDGNYFPPENAKEENSAPSVEQEQPKQEEPAEEVKEEPINQEQEPEYDEFGGYYDLEGNYKYKNGTYYDPEGNFHDENGSVIDPNGNVISQAEPTQEEQTQQESATEELEEPKEEKLSFEEIIKAEEVQEESLFDSKEAKEEPQEETPSLFEKEEEKRGRGRPKKEKSPEEIEEENKPKRGRGRPKKEKSPEDEKPKKSRGRGRPKKVKTTEELAEEENKPKRGRGRPKKEKKEEKPKSSRGRGRPKKNAEEVVEQPKEDVDDLSALDMLTKQIDEENQKLEQQQKELAQAIDSTFSDMDLETPDTDLEDSDEE